LPVRIGQTLHEGAATPVDQFGTIDRHCRCRNFLYLVVPDEDAARSRESIALSIESPYVLKQYCGRLLGPPRWRRGQDQKITSNRRQSDEALGYFAIKLFAAERWRQHH